MQAKPEEAAALPPNVNRGVDLNEANPLLLDTVTDEGFAVDGPVVIPWQVFFIFGSELCERFSYYGMRAVLFLYLTRFMRWSDDDATAWFQGFFIISSFASIAGALLADSKVGKFWGIVVFSALLVGGNALLAVTAIPGVTGTPPHNWGVIAAIFLLAFGSGALKPCVATFGGDQYTSAHRTSLQTYFAIYYFTINVGSLLSMVITPKLRAEVACYGLDSCYPLAFGLPAILMCVALVVFLAGRRFYVIKPPSSQALKNTILSLWIGGKLLLRCTGWKLGCVAVTSARSRSPVEGSAASDTEQLLHPSKTSRSWVQRIEERFGAAFLADLHSMRLLLGIVAILPFYWALSDQQGSTWTFQASQLHTVTLGRLGRILADQMQAVNGILVLLFIPLFDRVVYPVFAYLRGRGATPLQRMTLGMAFASAAFVTAGFLQMRVEAQTIDTGLQPVSNATHTLPGAAVTVLNTCHTSVTWSLSGWARPVTLAGLTATSAPAYTWHAPGAATVAYTSALGDATLDWVAAPGEHVTFVAGPSASGACDRIVLLIDAISSADIANTVWASFRVFNGLANETLTVSFLQPDAEAEDFSLAPETASNFTAGTVNTGELTFKFKMQDRVVDYSVFLEHGAMHTVIVAANGTVEAVFGQENTLGTQISILWQLPQYFLGGIAEILFSVTGFEFMFCEAPESLKAVMMSLFLVTDAFGNVIIIILAKAIPVGRPSTAFFIYAAMMGGVVFLFAFVASRYSYRATRDRRLRQDSVDEVCGRNGDSSKYSAGNDRGDRAPSAARDTLSNDARPRVQLEGCRPINSTDAKQLLSSSADNTARQRGGPPRVGSADSQV